MTKPQPPAALTPRQRLSPTDWQGLKELVAQRLAEAPMGRNEYGFDPFGACPEEALGLFTLAAWMHDFYFRVMVSGLENIPQGRGLLIANHGGQVPADGMMVSASVMMDGAPPRLMRAMAEFWFADQPFLGVAVSRVGSMIGTRSNCIQQLRHDELVLVFPEGARGMNKTIDKAYELQEFGLGFVRMALAAEAPIVPVAVVGSEEQAPGLVHSRLLASIMGLPHFPVTPFFPLLGPLGLLPMPTRYRIYFGEPLHFEGDAEDDDAVIAPMVEEVRASIRALIQQGKKERKSIFG